MGQYGKGKTSPVASSVSSLIPNARERASEGARIAPPDDLWPISAHFESALDASEEDENGPSVLTTCLSLMEAYNLARKLMKYLRLDSYYA